MYQFHNIDASDNMPSIEELKSCLLDLKESVGKRTCAIFYLRSKGTKVAMDTLLESIQNRLDSELMRHEIAYALGQVGSFDACAVLEDIVADEGDDLLVRHESAEALGAIGNPSSTTVLKKFLHHENTVLAQTCELSLAYIRHKRDLSRGEGDESLLDSNPYSSRDPALAFEKAKPLSELREIILDQTKPLYDRYRAMFSLRNRNTEEAALILCEALEDPSSLFCHEVAYIMGQMSNPVTVPTLIKVLKNKELHPMVRHEAAESLGSIKNADIRGQLENYIDDDSQIVSESCEIGLDIMDVWGIDTPVVSLGSSEKENEKGNVKEEQ